MIPNVYRFVFGLRPQTEPFHLLHYLCLASCLATRAPDRIVIHLRNEPFGPLWDRIRPHVEIEQIDDADMQAELAYKDAYTASFSYAHLADFVRLRVLAKHGGIYADMDTLFLRPLPADLFEAPCVMGLEPVDLAAPNRSDGSLCNAFIMAEPNAEFIRLWLDGIQDAFDGSWSNHSTFLPFRLSQQAPHLVRVEPQDRFYALDWTPQGIGDLFERDCTLPEQAVSLHLWAHLWWSAERVDFSRFSHEDLTAAYVAGAATTYARLARPLLPVADPSTGRTPKRAKGRAVLLTPAVPDPYGWGLPRRAWSWVCDLSGEHDVETIVVSSTPPTAADARAYPVHYIHLAGEPLQPKRLRDFAPLDAAAARTLATLEGPVPQRVVVFRLYLHEAAALLPRQWREIAEVDCDDWEARTRLSLAHVSMRLGRWRDAFRRTRESLRYARFERRQLASYKSVYISAREDADQLNRLYRLKNVRVRPNRIAPLIDAKVVIPTPDRPTLLFVGTLGYEPNEDAVRWIGKEIAPRLRRLLPNVEFMIAGEAAEPLQHFMREHRLTHVPCPGSVSPVYGRASIAIAPLRAGGGTKIKVLEAWQHGKPVVATSHAARGLDAIPGTHLIVADSAAAFAAGCARLLSDADLARHVAEVGRHLFHESYEL